MWNIAPVRRGGAASSPIALYADYVHRLEEQHRRREVIDHLEQGMSVLDRDGRVTLWNDALERMLHCSRDRALGQLAHRRRAGAGRAPSCRKPCKDTLADRQGPRS